MTTISSSSVERRCRPLDEWPLWDRRQWQSALQAGDVLEQGGCRAERSPFSNRAMVKGYGRWLAWLDSRGLLDAQVSPSDRITPDRVRAYVGHLEAKNASGTVIARIIELKVTAAIMDAERDWSWIYRLASSMRARHKPARPKRHRLVHIGRLLTLGLDLMEKADSETTTLCKFKTHRDGLMIGLLASRQLRLRNLAASSARKKSPPVVAASDTAAVNSTFRSAVTEERPLHSLRYQTAACCAASVAWVFSHSSRLLAIMLPPPPIPALLNRRWILSVSCRAATSSRNRWT